MRWPLRLTTSAAALLAGALLGSIACENLGKAGRAARVQATCEGFCRLVVRSSKASGAGDCYRECRARLLAEEGDCVAEVAAWLDCEVATSAQGSPVDALVLKRAGASKHCVSEYVRASECSEVYQKSGVFESGVLSLDGSGGERLALFEVEHHGRSPCIARPGAGRGATCDSAKICGSSCLRDRAHAENVAFRACVERHCAAETELLRLYPRVARVLESRSAWP